jgi:arylsulfatase A-like enzyme
VLSRVNLTANAMRSIPMLSIALALVFCYHFLFQLSKPSPLSEASVAAVVRVISYAWVSVAALTIVLLPVAVLGDLVGNRLVRRRVGTVPLVAGVYALGSLAVVENFTYTVFDVGLRNSNSAWLRLFVLIISLGLAVMLVRWTIGLSQRAFSRYVRLALPMLLIAAGVIAFTLVRGVDGGSLTATRTPELNNVLILSADGIAADRMSVYGYDRATTPFLESRASEFMGFRNAFTNNGNTTGSITALLTGMSPLTTGVVYPPDRLSGDYALRTLPRLLGEVGYYRSNWAVPHFADERDQNLVAAFDMNNGANTSKPIVPRLPVAAGVARWFLSNTFDESWKLLADVAGTRGLDNDFAQVAHIEDGSSLTDQERLGGILEDVRKDVPFFINAHFMGTHGPRFEVQRPFFSLGEVQEDDFARDFYDDALRQFDAYAADIFVALERAGKLDSTLIIITSDHSIRHVASERVPLLIRFPAGKNAGWHDVNVQRLDIAPTVLDFVGFRTPSWMEGLSLLDLDDLPHDRQISALNTVSAENVPGLGWIRRDDNTLLTVVRCDSYLTRDAAGEVRRGQVPGSTSPCRDLPRVPVPTGSDSSRG